MHFFQLPEGQKQKASNKQNLRPYYAKNLVGFLLYDV